MKCCIEDCEKKAALLPNGKPRHGGKCYTHAWRAKKGLPMNEPIRPYGLHPLKRLELKAIELRDADSEDDAGYRRVRELLRKIAAGYKTRQRTKPDNLQKRTKTHGQG